MQPYEVSLQNYRKYCLKIIATDFMFAILSASLQFTLRRDKYTYLSIIY